MTVGAPPTVSVVMATYNLVAGGRTEAVERALQSLFRQGRREAELLIQDGGSEDGTLPLLERLTAESPLPVAIETQPDGGIYDGMNRGAARAAGRYILFLNSDDTLADDTVLERIGAAAGDSPAFIHGATILRAADGTERVTRGRSPKAVLQRMPFGHNSVAIRRDLFEAMGGHDTAFHLAADYDLVFRLFEAGHVGQAVEGVICRFWPGGATADDAKVGADYARVWQARFARYLDMAPYSQAECEGWYRRGNLPLAVPLAVWRGSPQGSVLRRAARHSLWKTLRRTLNPFRRSA